jgi:hypothetical protein
MTTPRTTLRQDPSFTRDLFYAARYCLSRPRVLLTLAATAIVAGLALNWSWLVAAGLAPILISTLPCLVMCAFGVCVMCRSADKPSAPLRDAADGAGAPAALAISATDKPATDAAGCCQGSGQASMQDSMQDLMNETAPEQTIDPQPYQERRDTHA